MTRREPPGKVRIIAGRWRGRRLAVGRLPGLRPTSDRIRETLFNWLGQELADARCLDLFAGTGALGFEAASRGAARVTLVERDPQLAEQLRAECRRLEATQIRVVHADAHAWLRDNLPEPFDIVFLDPPFAEAALWNGLLEALSDGWLSEQATLYLELPCGRALPVLPAGWHLAREKTAGRVRFCLARGAHPA